jgi:hypothetical protein
MRKHSTSIPFCACQLLRLRQDYLLRAVLYPTFLVQSRPCIYPQLLTRNQQSVKTRGQYRHGAPLPTPRRAPRVHIGHRGRSFPLFMIPHPQNGIEVALIIICIIINRNRRHLLCMRTCAQMLRAAHVQACLTSRQRRGSYLQASGQPLRHHLRSKWIHEGDHPGHLADSRPLLSPALYTNLYPRLLLTTATRCPLILSTVRLTSTI